MRLMARAREMVERRMRGIEQALRGIDGLRVERRGDGLTVRVPKRRWIADMRLRFLGRGR